MPLVTSPASLVSPTLDCAKKDGPQLCAVLPGVSREPGFDAASAAYEAFNERRFAQATTDARKVLQLSRENREYQRLLVKASVGWQQYAQTEAAASMALAADNSDAALIAQRGFIRQRLGLDALAREDFQRALDTGQLPVATEIGLLANLGRKAQARQRFDEALVTGRLVSLSDMDIAYLCAVVLMQSRLFKSSLSCSRPHRPCGLMTVLALLLMLGSCAAPLQVIPPLAGVVWQIDSNTLDPRGNWDRMGASELRVQWTAVDSMSFVPNTKMSTSPRLPAWQRIAEEPWAKSVILGLAGRFDEKAARAGINDLAASSLQLAACKITDTAECSGLVFPGRD